MDDSNIAFNDGVSFIENNLSGLVTITNNSLTNAFYQGIDIFNWAGTLDDLVITNNTITSSTSTDALKGGGIRIIVRGADLTKATIDNNTVTNFPSGVGFQVQAGDAFGWL